MNQQIVIGLFGLFLLVGYDEVTSTDPFIMIDDHEYCRYSEAEEDLCGSYCYKIVKPTMEYVNELEIQITATSEQNLQRQKEIHNIKGLLDKNNHKEEAQNNQQIKKLIKINEELVKNNQLHRENVQQLNYISIIDEMINNITNDQNSEIENMRNEIKALETVVAFYEKQFNNSQDQLTNKSSLVESTFLKLKQINSNLTKCHELIKKMPQACRNLPSGIQLIAIYGLDPFPALCNADIDGGGWIVIQKRFNGSEDFNRTWTDYRNGFGSLDGEFFIGLEKLYHITNSQSYELYIKMENHKGRIKFASYDYFKIGNEDTKYEINSLGEFEGSASHEMESCLNQKFATFDQDNDPWPDDNCALRNDGGWWYYYCELANLNGKYYNSSVGLGNAMRWDGMESLKSVEMLIRPSSEY